MKMTGPVCDAKPTFVLKNFPPSFQLLTLAFAVIRIRIERAYVAGEICIGEFRICDTFECACDEFLQIHLRKFANKISLAISR